MEGFVKKLSLVPRGLRYKLMIVFCLMSIIPLLVCVYVASNYVFPYVKEIGSISVVLVCAILIAMLGYALARHMVDPIIEMALQAKLIASGDFDRSVPVDREDEIGDLGVSLNIMTQKIKENISELEAYSERTKEINAKIHKKVIVLSGLLQVGNLISSGAELKTILDALVDKISLLDESTSVLIVMVDKDRDKDCLVPVSRRYFDFTEASKLPVSLHSGIFAELRSELKEIVIDRHTTEKDKDIQSYKELYKLQNSVILPIVLRGSLEGVLIVGNNQGDYEYNEDELELLRLFCKQIAIVIENDLLLKKAEGLEIKDELTGLYNSKFIRERLDEEIKRAIIYQRPCSFILLSIDNFAEFCKEHGRLRGETALKKIAELILQELTPIDKAARFADDEFALLLPERNKRETRQIAEDVQKKISELILVPDAEKKYRHLTVSASLSENPIDGVSSRELISRAQALLKEGKTSGRGIVKM